MWGQGLRERIIAPDSRDRRLRADVEFAEEHRAVEKLGCGLPVLAKLMVAGLALMLVLG